MPNWTGSFGYFQLINEKNPDAALRFLRAIDQSIEELLAQPFLGRLCKFHGSDLKDIRSWRVKGFGEYLIFYQMTEPRLEILRIKHGAMNFPDALRKH